MPADRPCVDQGDPRVYDGWVRRAFAGLVLAVGCAPDPDPVTMGSGGGSGEAGTESASSGNVEAERGCAAVMRDSEGVLYPTKVEAEICLPVDIDLVVDCGDREQTLYFAWDRFYFGCPSCSSSLTECRPLLCETDDECPMWPDGHPGRSEGQEYECRDGFCQNVDIEAYPEDLVSTTSAGFLCRASLPRGEVYGPVDCAALIENDEGQITHCGLPLPDDCLQPQ